MHPFEGVGTEIGVGSMCVGARATQWISGSERDPIVGSKSGRDSSGGPLSGANDFPVPLAPLLDALGSAFSLAVFDPAGRLRWVNEAWERLTGYSEDQLLGFPHWEVLVHPVERTRLKEQGARRVAGLPVPEVYDSIFVRKDQTPVPVEVAIRTVRAEDETWILAVVRDISARRASEEKARHLAAIVDSTSDAVVSISTDGTITSWNAAAEQMFGYAAGEAVGRHIGILAEEGGPSDMSGLLERVLGGGVVTGHETSRRHRDGSLVPVSLSGGPMFSEAGDVVGFAGIYRDISERVRADEERRRRDEAERVQASALEASRLKSEFLATMSHEIRTPMNGVIGMTGLLLDTDLDDEQREYAETVCRSAETLLALINDILDFSKIEAGRLELEEVDFDVAVVAEEVAELLSIGAHEKGLELLLRLDPALPAVVRGDPGRVRQVLLNLVGNAVKFTDTGEVLVTVTGEPMEANAFVIRCEVRDTGIGIAPEVQPVLFESFTQADAATTRRHGGTGLGLAISRRLVELMGGRIGLDSASGAGSTFWFTLPLPIATGRPPRPMKLVAVHALIVDDLASNIDILARQLSAWGMTVVTTSSGHDALRAVRTANAAGTPFDIVLTDFQMPGMDGVDLADALQTEFERPPPVVVLSSAGGREAARGRSRASVAQFLIKPARRSQLFDAISTALGDAPVGARPARHPSSLPARRGGRVLVVDDNPVNQRFATLVLEKAGYRVDAASDGRQAVDAVSTLPYDAVLMDCEMPVMDGYQAATEIRRREAPGQRVPIIAVTASAMRGDVERAMAAGMDAHVAKPIDRVELAEVLADLIEHRGEAPVATPSKREPAGQGRVLDPATVAELRQLDGTGAALRHLIGLFISNAPVLMAEIQQAAGTGDHEAVRTAVHKLGGSAGLFGQGTVYELASQLDRDARNGEPLRHETIATLGAALNELIDALMIARDAAG